MIDRAACLHLWRTISPTAAAATLRVRSAAPAGGGGWTYTDYALTHAARGPLERYQSAGNPDADADHAPFQIWADDLALVGAPVPRRHDLIVQSGATYEIDEVTNALFDAVYLCETTKAGPGVAA